MHRFYYPALKLISQQIALNQKEEIHHIRNVLRLKPKDRIVVFNGKGQEATGTILSVSPQKIFIHILNVQHSKSNPVSVVLACAIPKKSKFEAIIEKTTELGVDEIIPLQTKRTQIKLKGARLQTKVRRYETVAINAAKQSKRTTIPLVHTVTSFSCAVTALTQNALVFIPSLDGEHKNLLKALSEFKAPHKIAFLIGPEGDFTPEEYALARRHGCIPVSLGATTLKVDTAATSAISCAHLFFGT